MAAGESKEDSDHLIPHLLRYGEIGTKSSNIRKHFEDILIDNIERTFLSRNKEVVLEKEGLGRIFAYTQDENSYLFSRIFGIVSYSPVKKLRSNIEEINDEAKKFADRIFGTFAVRARRVGQHEYTSQDIEDEVGRTILNRNPDLQVNLDEPEHEFHIEVRHDRAYIFTKIEEGPGGLPLSSQGKVAARIEDKYDFLATWLMMKRGARPYVLIQNERWGDRLRKWDPNLKKIDRKSFDRVLKSEHPKDIKGLVSGERLEDYSEKQHDVMIIRPLIGFTEKKIEKYFEIIKRLESKCKGN